MIAAVIGSTGLTGSVLVRQLLASPLIDRVVSVSRTSLAISNAKLTELQLADLGQLATVASRMRADLYFCCLGTTIQRAGSRTRFEQVDHDAVVSFATIAKAHDTRACSLVSAMGANARSMVFYNRVKGRTEDDVMALGLRSLIIFRPALLAGPRREFRLAERAATAVVVPLAGLLPARAGKSLVTKVETLADRMLAEGLAARVGVRIIKAADI